MNERIFEGRNVQAAVEKACKSLGMTAEALVYDVISYGSSGIFGIVGIKKAKIRVRLPSPVSTDTILQRQEADIAAEPFPAVDEAAEPQEVVLTHPSGHTESTTEIPQAGSGTLPIEDWKRFLSAVASRLADSPVVEVSQQDGRVVFSIESPECEHLIGKKGQTLSAVLHILRKYVQKTDPSLQVFIDVNRFRERKTERLTLLTTKVIQKVVQHGRPIAISSLSLKEREIVQHLIEQDERVRAKTFGNGPSRKMIVSLAPTNDHPA